MTDRPEHKIQPPRYTRRAFPAYAYLPGRDPHPTRDPDGHSYATDSPALDHFDPGRWQDCEEYFYGIDLLNHGYYWEAHEALEAVWLAAGQRRTEAGRFVQGLLQIGVGMLKLRQGHDQAARRMWQSGLDKLRGIDGVYLGVDTTALRQAVDRLLNGETRALPRIELTGIQRPPAE